MNNVLTLLKKLNHTTKTIKMSLPRPKPTLPAGGLPRFPDTPELIKVSAHAPRTTIINDLIRDNNYQSYLEIGVYDHKNFNAIDCPVKVGVDPNPKVKATNVMTSDEFFKRNRKTYGLIFIDGLHHAEQVIRDIENALNCLSPGGTIVVHDCNPTTEAMQVVPRQQGEWTGDVWKAWQHFRQRDDLTMWVYDVDYGVGVIRKGKQEPLMKPVVIWQDFDTYRDIVLNLRPYITVPISICIPAFEQYGHGSKTLKQLLDSLKDQTGEFEIVVSDNGGTLEELCSQYPAVRYFNNPTRGISANTNYAIAQAKYEHIKIMYQDDIAYPGMVEAFNRALAIHPWVVASGFGINEHGIRRPRQTQPRWTDQVIHGRNTIGMPSVTGFKKPPFEFDTNLRTLLDCEYYWRLHKEYGEPWVLHAPLIGSRYWDGSTSRKQGNLTAEESVYLREKWPQIRNNA